MDDPRYAMVDLEFDSPTQAATFREGLQQLWRKVDGKIIEQPRARIVQVLEFKEI